MKDKMKKRRQPRRDEGSPCPKYGCKNTYDSCKNCDKFTEYSNIQQSLYSEIGK